MTRIAAEIAEALGPSCRAVILHGSLAAGGFRPGVSDLDLLVIVEAPLTDDQATSLVRRAGQADLGDAAALDLHVVTADVARHPTPAPPLELSIGHDPEVERRVPAEPDLPAELSMARQDGRPLRGDLNDLAPVPPEWVVTRGRHWLRTWLTRTDDKAHAAFMVLTACRIWHYAAEHTHLSKTEAGRWALTRDPSLTAVRQALRNAPVDAAGIAAVLTKALDRIA